MGVDPKLYLTGWSGHSYVCDPRAPLGGGGPGSFRWAGATFDPFADSEDLFHPLGPTLRHGCCVSGMGPPAGVAPPHPTELVWTEVQAEFEKSEGRIPHMYLDSEGLLTVAIGKRLFSVEDAQKLPFVRRADGKAATKAEIKTDYDKVSQQPGKQKAYKYKPHTALDLPEEEIDKLLKSTVEGFVKSLKADFAGYDSYPAPAKRALLDMIYNLGRKGLKSYTGLRKAAEEGRWKDAAKKCRRGRIPEDRNAWTRDLFLQAAN